MSASDSLRVLVVHSRYRSDQPSGEDRVVDQETELLAAAGHRVTLFERRSDDIAGMSLPAKMAIPFLVPWNPGIRAELARRLRAERPDVVHIHSTFPLISPSVIDACNDAGVPAVATLHNYTQICAPGPLYRDGRVCTECVGRRAPLPAVRHGCYRGSALATVPVAIGQLVNRRRWWTGVSRFFCVSRAQRQILIAAGMPADRLAVNHNFVPDPPVRRTGRGRHVLYLGRLTEEKGVPLLMRAWERAAGPVGLPLLVAGAGPLDAELRRWADRRTDVHVVGLQSRERCAELMAEAAVLVAPSVWLEVFGLVVAEAMAAGVPVVAAAHGAFVELVTDEVSGLLHRPGDAGSLADALAAVVSDADRNMAMGRAGRRAYEAGLTPAASLGRLVSGYRAAMAGLACAPV
jgi:glycosyltransferase involved in cell wall biosynthesis